MTALLTITPADHGFAADWGSGQRHCAVGIGGVGEKLREGDGVTPVGTWPLRRVFYRADKLSRPQTRLPLVAIGKDDGWCDAPGDPNYNRLVDLPYPASAEKLWRDDALYDIVVVIGFNDAPVIVGKGSAIFIHVAAPDFSSTRGCVALRENDLLELLAALTPEAQVLIERRLNPARRK